MGNAVEQMVNEDGETALAVTLRRSNTEHAYLELKRRILDNEIPAGTRYLEQEVAELLGMSRTPVREALIRLAKERLVEVKPRHGMRVLPISIDDMREIYELLTELEAFAAKRAAERHLSADDIRPLEAAVEDMERALAAAELSTWAAADDRFHRVLARLAGNSRLEAAIEACCEQVHRARMLTLAKRPPPMDSNRDHADVVAAIRNGDGARAFEVHHRHRESAGKMLLALLQTQGLESL